LLRDEPGVGAADLALLHTTRAHAHAALGDEDQAEAELSTLADELGSDVLSFAIDIEGPASPIAETVRASFDAGSNAPADEPDDAPADEPDDAPADEPDDERAAD